MKTIKNISTPLNKEKTKILINYIALKSDIGRTKLLKLLYLMDFNAYQETRNSITNDEYQHWALGPVPINIWNEINSENIHDYLFVEKTRTEEGRIHYKYRPKEENINLKSYFTSKEIEVINDVLSKYGNMSIQELLDLIHKEYTYTSTSENETIPYYLALYRQYGEEEKERQKKKITENKQLMDRIKKKYDKYVSIYSDIICNES